MNLSEILCQAVEKKVREADISDLDWWENILQEMPCNYAKGYLRASSEPLYSNMEATTEEFREEVLDRLNRDIWK